jgi:hypothetical protein
MNGTGVYYLASAADKVGSMLLTCFLHCYICHLPVTSCMNMSRNWCVLPGLCR